MRINSIKCKRSHRKKAEKRFFRALLAFLAGIILKSNGIQAIAGGLTLTDQNRGIRYLYREADGETALTEPRGYDGYQWQESQDQQNYTDVDTTSAQTRMFLPDTIRSGTTYFRCIASAAGENFILGEDYAIVYYRLPTVRGLRIKEVSHAG